MTESVALFNELQRNGAISTIGLRLSDPKLPYKQFEALCVLLGRMNQAVKFAIGDAIILGEQLYGEKAFQAFEGFCLSEETMQEYVRVASRVARSRRREDLSWSHHRAVATLQPPEQKQWLSRAAEENLSHAVLREELRLGRPAAETSTCRCCHRPF